MDHFKTFDPSKLPDLNFPYLCSPSFEQDFASEEEFVEYPSAKGFLNRELRNFRSNNSSEEEAFIQNWLFFGFIQVLLKIHELPYNRSDFLRWENGRPFLTSKQLPQYLSRWLEAETQSLEMLRGDRLRKAKQYLHLLRDILIVVENESLLITLDKLLAPVRAMAFSFTNMLKHSDWGYYFIGFSPGFGTYEFLLGHLKASDWCPYDIERLKTNVYIDSHVLLSSMSSARAKFSHSTCSDYACTALNINEETYQTEHVAPSCECTWLEMPIKKLHNIVLREGIPLVRHAMGSEDDGTGFLEVMQNDGTVPNVAISHVWADGLGNTDETNSLPSCQLKKLQSMVNELYEPDDTVWFYIDSLCVPKDKSLRRQAIMKMRDVYQQASKVLVIDKDIATSEGLNDIVSLAARIYCSSWTHRLWTYQEAILNPALYFQLLNGPIALKEIKENSLYRFESSPPSQANLVSSNSMLSYVSITLGLRQVDANIPKALEFAMVIDGIRHRTTSRASDETICLSIILKLDLAPILLANTEERMQIFLRNLKFIPLALIIFSEDRINQPGFSWAPKSILGSTSTQDSSSMSRWYSNALSHDYRTADPVQLKIAEVLDNGEISFQAHGFKVDATGLKEIGSSFALMEKEWSNQIEQYCAGRYVFCAAVQGNDLSSLLTLDSESPFYVVCIDDKGSTFSAILLLPDVTGFNDESGSISCRFYRRLHVVRHNWSSFMSIDHQAEGLKTSDGVLLALDAIPLEEQKWVVA